MSWTTLVAEHQRSHPRRAAARKGMQIFSSRPSTDDRGHRPLAKSNHSMCRKLRPSVQPSSASPCMNGAPKDFLTGSFWSKAQRKLIRRTRSACCARAANGHAADKRDELPALHVSFPRLRITPCGSKHSTSGRSGTGSRNGVTASTSIAGVSLRCREPMLRATSVDIAMSALSSAIHNTGHYHVRLRPVCLPPSACRASRGGSQARLVDVLSHLAGHGR
jgi:hypothetical protein